MHFAITRRSAYIILIVVYRGYLQVRIYKFSLFRDMALPYFDEHLNDQEATTFTLSRIVVVTVTCQANDQTKEDVLVSGCCPDQLQPLFHSIAEQ